MAQRDKKEEPTELRAPEIALCANNCGFPGNPATQNLCQSCFSASRSSSSSSSQPSPTSSPSASAPAAAVPQPRPALLDAALQLAPPAAAAGQPVEASARTSANRCSSCRKRVGLTGFRCRCGDLFCGAHRYSDRHGCRYDYRGAARDAIARENPVVRAAKIVRF